MLYGQIKKLCVGLGVLTAYGCLMVAGGEGGSLSTTNHDVLLDIPRFTREIDENKNFGLSWSPDGKQIVFMSKSGKKELWTVNRAGKDRRLLVSGGSKPHWSPDGREIIFEAVLKGPSSNIWGMDQEGNNLRQLTDDEENQNFCPIWSPNGREMAYISFSVKPPRDWVLWVKDRESGQGRILAIEKYILPSFSWSPDGSKIAFASSRSGNWDIWVVDREGENLRQLTTSIARDELPTWSPDGKSLAFVSERSGNQDIWLMDSEGSNLRQLTHDKMDNHHPAWSPDGRKLAFLSNRTGHDEVWVMDRDGSRQVALTHGQARHDIVRWSPDGGKIAFIAYQAGISDVGIVDVDHDGEAMQRGQSLLRIAPEALQAVDADTLPEEDRLP